MSFQVKDEITDILNVGEMKKKSPKFKPVFKRKRKCQSLSPSLTHTSAFGHLDHINHETDRERESLFLHLVTEKQAVKSVGNHIIYIIGS